MGWLDRLVGIWKAEDPEVRAHADVTAMSRRRFVQLLAGSAAVAAAAPMLDVERLLWTPGQTLVVPEMGGNILLTADWITREMMRVMMNNLKMVSLITRQFDERYDSATLVHPTITVKKPNFGRDTISDWNTRIRPEMERSIVLTDTALPIDCLTRSVTHVPGEKAEGFGVVGHSDMTVRLITKG